MSDDKLKQELDALIRRQEEESAEAIRTAVERGGLPTEAEADAVYNDLQQVFNEVEGIVWRVKAIAGAGYGGEVPIPITFEQLGILAVLSADIEERTEELAEFAKQLQHYLQRDLNTLREEQQYQAKQALRDA
jgi:hypothetical protein